MGAPVVLGNTHATVAKGQDGKIYFSGNTGSAWQVSRLQSPHIMANENNNVTFALDPAYHRASSLSDLPRTSAENAGLASNPRCFSAVMAK